MMDNNVEIKKRKRGSKNRKKAWKTVDVEDVEQHLEDVRKDERTGGPVSEVQNQNLFFLEKSGNESAGVSKKRSKLKKQEESDGDDDEEAYVPKKQRFMENLYKQKEEELKAKKAKRSVVNVWGQEELSVPNGYLESTVKRKKIKPNTVNVGKLQGVDAVLKPHPGTSYNPDYDAHQDLLAVAREEEQVKLKDAIKLNNKVKMVSVEQLKKQGDIWLKEMSEGLNKNAESESDSEDGDDDDNVTSRRTKERKTNQQKRRKKLRKLDEKERADAKITNTRVHEVFRLRTLNKEIRKAEKMHAEKMEEKKKQLEESEKTKTKRLSQYKFQEQSVNYKLSEDLCSTLREMKPEGNLIKDRYRSLQRRNIIEVRRPVVPHRRYRRKVVTRRSYLQPTISDFNPTRKKGT